MKHAGHEGSHSVIFSVCVMTDASSACSYTIGKWASASRPVVIKTSFTAQFLTWGPPLFVMAHSLSIQIHAPE